MKSREIDNYPHHEIETPFLKRTRPHVSDSEAENLSSRGYRRYKRHRRNRSSSPNDRISLGDASNSSTKYQLLLKRVDDALSDSRSFFKHNVKKQLEAQRVKEENNIKQQLDLISSTIKDDEHAVDKTTSNENTQPFPLDFLDYWCTKSGTTEPLSGPISMAIQNHLINISSSKLAQHKIKK